MKLPSAPLLLALIALTITACQPTRVAELSPAPASTGRLRPEPRRHRVESLLDHPDAALVRDTRTGRSWFGPRRDPKAETTWVLPVGQSVTIAIERPVAGSLVVKLGAGGDLELKVVEPDWLSEHAPTEVAHTSRVGANDTKSVSLPSGRGDVSLVTFTPVGRTAHLETLSLFEEAPRKPLVEAEATVRNVVVMVVDTLRADALAPYAPDTHVRTPRLTAWAKDALVFDRAYAPVNWTKPSVASLLTGTMPHEHGVTTHTARVPEHLPTAASWLTAHGFRTGAFSTNGYISKDFGFDRGWGHFRAPNPRRTTASELVKEAGRWLKRQPAGQPFFLYVHTTDCHAPYRPSKASADGYLAGTDRTPRVDFIRSPRLLTQIRDGSVQLDLRERAQLKALYEGTITDHDAAFGLLLDTLRAQERLEDTAVVFVADHGEEFFEHGSVGHGPQLHAELTRIPLLIGLPGARVGARVTSPVGSSDVFPTLLHWLGLPAPPSVSGRNLLATYPGAITSVRSEIRSQTALTTRRYRLLRQEDSGSLALFDHADDPLEQRPITDTHPTLARLLERTLIQGRRTGTHMDAPSQPTDIAPEMEAQLRALGYVGSQRAD